MEWKLLCIKKHEGIRCFYFELGIIPIDHDTIDEDRGITKYGYGLNVARGRIDQFNKKNASLDIEAVQENDIINIKYVSVTSNGDKSAYGELYFGLNDEPLIKAFDDIKIKDDEQYIFGVSLYYLEETVQLIQ